MRLLAPVVRTGWFGGVRILGKSEGSVGSGGCRPLFLSGVASARVYTAGFGALAARIVPLHHSVWAIWWAPCVLKAAALFSAPFEG